MFKKYKQKQQNKLKAIKGVFKWFLVRNQCTQVSSGADYNDVSFYLFRK